MPSCDTGKKAITRRVGIGASNAMCFLWSFCLLLFFLPKWAVGGISFKSPVALLMMCKSKLEWL